VIFQLQEGIPPHSHPFGEDCAVVLSGHLDYYISNKKIYIFEGENAEIKTSNPIVFIKYTARL